MWLSDHYLETLFPFGMGMERLDARGGADLRGPVGPHENPDWFNLWITEGANTVLPREVEDAGSGSFIATFPSGERRRLYPLAEREKVDIGYGLPEPAEQLPAEHIEDPAPKPEAGSAPVPERRRSTVREMQYFLAHDDPETGRRLGLWAGPGDGAYIDGATAEQRAVGERVVNSWDRTEPWPTFVDRLAWGGVIEGYRWELCKWDSPYSPADWAAAQADRGEPA